MPRYRNKMIYLFLIARVCFVAHNAIPVAESRTVLPRTRAYFVENGLFLKKKSPRSAWLDFAFTPFPQVCQTARPTEGRPHASTEVSSHAGSSSAQDSSLSISRLIEEAYRNQELLPPQRWTDDQGIGQTEWNTTEQQESSSDRMMQYRTRKLLQGTFTLYEYRLPSDQHSFLSDTLGKRIDNHS